MYNKMGKNAYKIVDGQVRKGVVIASGLKKDIYEKEDVKFITVLWKDGQESYSVYDIGRKLFFSREAAISSMK